MREKVLDKNLESTNDYKTFREEADNESLVNEFMSEFQGEAKVAVDIPTEPEKEIAEGEEPEPTEGLFKRFVGDIARGTIGEGPRAIVSGATKGLNEMAQTIDDAAQWLNKNVASLPQTEKKFKVPQPKFGVDQAESPKSTTGNLIEDVTQFLVGFGAAGKAIKGVKAVGKGAKAAKFTAQSGLGDVLAFDEQEQRLSNVIQDVPELQNPITEFLESDPEDSTAEAKFKQGLEGAGLGLVGEGLGKAVSVLRKNRQIKKGVEAQLEGMEKAAEPGLKSEQLSSLGRPESNEFIFNKLQTAAKETEGLGAKTIAEAKPKNADEIGINFARIDGPEDLKEAMQAYANETKLLPKVKDARRGVRSNQATLKDAEDIDGFKTLLERRQGQTLNAEETTSARNFYYNTTDKLMELAKKAAQPDATDIDQYAFRKMVATHHAVQKEVLGARAEAGRALQAWSIAAEGTPTDKLKGMESILDMFGGAEASKDLARKLAQFGDGQLTLSQVNHITTKSSAARTGDAMIEAWTAGLLTNPVTHVKNLASNTLTTLMSAGERYGQALFPQSNVTITEANSFVKGILESQRQAFASAGRAFRTGQTGFGTGKVELPRVRASSKEVLDLQGMAKPFGYAMDYYGRVVNTSFKALAAGDEYGKTVLHNAQLNALATRQGISQGLKGTDLKEHIAKTVSAPDSILEQEARDFANYATFTKELGKSGKSMQRILSQNPALKIAVPFFKTPVNIFKFTYERTPLAVASKAVREELGAGGTRQAAALAKIGTGSSIMAMGVDMSINGQVTGNGPTNPKTRSALMRQGWRPHSIKVGDKYISYQGLEPLSTLFALSADMAEILTNYEMYDAETQDEVDHLAPAIVMTLSDATINKTFLSGLSNIMEGLANPEMKGPQLVQRTLSSLVPSGAAAVERAVNPEREYVTNTIDAFKARTPGFSDQVAKRRNVYGETIQYRYPDEGILDQTTSAITSLFNPFYTSIAKDDPLDRYLLQNGYFVGMPSKTQTFEGSKVNLRDYPEAYSRLLELRGQEVELIQWGNTNMKTALTELVTEGSFRSVEFQMKFTDDEKQDVIKKLVNDYNNAAKEILRDEFPVIDQLILEDKLKQEQTGGF
jgi:hypothetical protein